MTDLRQSSQEGLVPTSSGALARSAGLVGRGLRLIQGHLKKRKVLVTDDSEAMLVSLKQVIEALGYDVVALENKIEAHKRLGEIKPDLVTTDLGSPGLGGLDFIRLVKEFDPSIPVIILSGNVTLEAAREAVRLGVFDCLDKPFDVLYFSQVIDRALGTRRILCVNDEPSPLASLKYVLEPQGYEVLTTTDGTEAVRILLTKPVDLLIQNVARPFMNGFELYAMMQANERLRNVPVVIYSAYHESRRKFLDRYPDVAAVLEIPWTVEHILDVVRKAVGANY
jgi:CheY-like chemotaxis protein